MIIAPPQLPKLYPKQRSAIFSPARYSIIEASTKAGKTSGCLIWLLVLAWNAKHGRNFWWVAPVFSQAKVAYNRLKRMMIGSDPQKRVWTCHESEMWIEFASGGRIWFKSADNPDLLYGEDVYGAVIDEASRCKEAAWHAVRSTLTSTGGPVRIIGNVRGRKNWAYQLARKAEAGEKGMAHFKLTAYDAIEGGILSADELEDARRALPENVFRELYLGEPSDDGGNPFGIDAIANCVQPISSGAPVGFGVDLGKSVDYTVICGLDETGCVCRLDRFRADWQQTTTRVSRAVGNVPTLADSTGVGDPIVERLQSGDDSLISGFKFTSNSKQQLMEGLAVAVQRGEVGFPDGWLRSELESFEYEFTRTGVRYSSPDGLHDDGVCALALAVECAGSHARTWGGEEMKRLVGYQFDH